jgi:hypothetical protein
MIRCLNAHEFPGDHVTVCNFHAVRLLLRITSFNPDQTSLTEHTLMSTSPIGKASSRITSSLMSVITFEAFFGQDTQMNPLCTNLLRKSVIANFTLVENPRFSTNGE